MPIIEAQKLCRFWRSYRKCFTIVLPYFMPTVKEVVLKENSEMVGHGI
ncbi:hypothetical protein [Mucilaginibacter sp. R-33]